MESAGRKEITAAVMPRPDTPAFRLLYAPARHFIMAGGVKTGIVGTVTHQRLHIHLSVMHDIACYPELGYFGPSRAKSGCGCCENGDVTDVSDFLPILVWSTSMYQVVLKI
jgi:hypothetical protein